MTWLWGKETDHLLNVRHICEVVYNVQNEKQHTRGGRTRAYGDGVYREKRAYNLKPESGTTHVSTKKHFSHWCR